MNNVFLLCFWTKVKLQLSLQEKLVEMRDYFHPGWSVNRTILKIHLLQTTFIQCTLIVLLSARCDKEFAARMTLM